MTEAILHVYDVLVPNNAQYNNAIKQFNNLLVSLNVGGILHGAIELYGYEYSFGFCPEGSGVYRCKPTQNPMYRYRSTHSLGTTTVTEDDFRTIIRTLMRTWPGTSYDLITRNCCHFCEDLAGTLRYAHPKFIGAVFTFPGQRKSYFSISHQIVSRTITHHACSTEHPVPSWLNRMAGGVHSAISTYKAASLSMHHLSEQLHSGWKWMASAGAVPPQLHACYSTPTLPSQGEERLTSTVAPPRRGQDMLLEGTLGEGTLSDEEYTTEEKTDPGHHGTVDGSSWFSPADRLPTTKSAPVLREEAFQSIARP